jgi:hypothetical protein
MLAHLRRPLIRFSLAHLFSRLALDIFFFSFLFCFQVDAGGGHGRPLLIVKNKHDIEGALKGMGNQMRIEFFFFFFF